MVTTAVPLIIKPRAKHTRAHCVVYYCVNYRRVLTDITFLTFFSYLKEKKAKTLYARELLKDMRIAALALNT